MRSTWRCSASGSMRSELDRLGLARSGSGSRRRSRPRRPGRGGGTRTRSARSRPAPSRTRPRRRPRRAGRPRRSARGPRRRARRSAPRRSSSRPAGRRSPSPRPRWPGSAGCEARSSPSAPSGSASASSKPFVCRLWAPPQTAESACTATRTMLFSACWAVSVEPPVWAWKRSICERGSRAPKRSRMISAHSVRAARNFATSGEEVVVGVEEEREPARERVDLEPGVDRRLDVGDAVGERERQLLRGRRARLADVVARDRDRVPARQPLGAVAEGVDGEAHARPGREDVVPAGDVLLQDVVLDRPGERLGRRRPAPRRRARRAGAGARPAR